MVNKMITVPHELYLKLSRESNASGLIQQLLIKHYQNNDAGVIDEVKEKMREEQRQVEVKEMIADRLSKEEFIKV